MATMKRRRLRWVPAVICLAAPAARADDASEAAFQYERGTILAAQSRYEDAIEAFRTSYRLVANAGVAFNVALVSSKLAGQLEKRSGAGDRGARGRAAAFYAEAFNWTQTCLEFTELPPERRAQAAALGDSVRPKVAVVAVEADPPGTEIFIERESLGSRGRAPRSIAVWSPDWPEGRPPASVLVLGKREGHKPAQISVELQVGSTAKAALVLPQLTGEVRVDSAPPGARVRDARGVELGATPLVLALPLGRAGLTAWLDQYIEQSKEIEVVEGQPVNVSFTLARAASTVAVLSVAAKPNVAAVKVNGQPVGQTPLSLGDLPPGQIHLAVEAAGLAPWSGHVSLEAGGATRVDVGLEPVVKPAWRGWKWLGYGGGGALLGSGLVVGGLARSRRSDFFAMPSADGKQSVERMNVTADVLMLSGLVTLGVSAAIHWFSPTAPTSRAQVNFDR